jgi:hypothetical protein
MYRNIGPPTAAAFRANSPPSTISAEGRPKPLHVDSDLRRVMTAEQLLQLVQVLRQGCRRERVDVRILPGPAEDGPIPM